MMSEPPHGGPLAIVGAGGFGRETVELVRAAVAAGANYELVGIYDDDPKLHNGQVMGVPVLGPVAAVKDAPDVRLVVTIGSPSNYRIRREIVTGLDLPARRYATLIHPTAVVPGSAHIGEGSVIHAHCVLTAEVEVGRHVVMMPAVVMTHDDVAGDYATFGSGAMLAGGVVVGEGAYVGAGALVREHTTIGEWALVGMGSVVTGNVPPGQVWAGNPARPIRRRSRADDEEHSA
jgi:sugar O-acyltransferase (sialic acid O-acetyltransferase NeuD family)